MTDQYLINHQLNKNVKIVPISKVKNEIKAWNCNDLPTDLQPDPDYLENLLRTVGNENVKIYAIDICAETDEEIKKENQVAKSKVRVISESAIKCIRKWADKPKNQEKTVQKKSTVRKIVDCCPWQIPWFILTISFIQVITNFTFNLISSILSPTLNIHNRMNRFTSKTTITRKKHLKIQITCKSL